MLLCSTLWKLGIVFVTACLPACIEMIRLLLLWIISACVAGYMASNYRQEQAKITYFNPKYVRDCQAFTGRQRRGDLYRTNITSTTLAPWSNNVTVEINYKAKSLPTPFTLDIGICDVSKIKWSSDYLRSYSNIKLKCPLPPGTYSLMNMEFPPTNFPLPVPKEDARLRLGYYVTKTKEIIMQVTLIVHAP